MQSNYSKTHDDCALECRKGDVFPRAGDNTFGDKGSGFRCEQVQGGVASKSFTIWANLMTASTKLRKKSDFLLIANA